MAGRTQQLPRVVPNTLFEVKFVQRGGKLYKILLPNPLKHNNPTNSAISQSATTPIVFEARNAKGLEIARKSNEPSPFLKPVTLSSAEYKAIPLFKRGERIVDTDWLPEETECIIQLAKSHKGFQDANSTSTENLLPKIVSVNSNECSSSTDKTASPLVANNVSEIEERQRMVSAFMNSQEESDFIKSLEKITPVCELKVEPLNGENCILSDIKPKANPLKNKINSKLDEVQANNSNCSLQTSKDVSSENIKSRSTLRNGKRFLSLKDNSVCSTNPRTAKAKSNEGNVALPEDAKSVPSIEMTSEECIHDSSNEEKSLLLERLKSARTVKVKHRGNNSKLAEETKPILQADVGKMNAEEFKTETDSSLLLPTSTNGVVKSESVKTEPTSQAQKKVLLRIERAENSMNSSTVTAAVALLDHDYALRTDSPPDRGTISNYSLRSVPKPKVQSASIYTYTESEKMSKISTKAQSRGRKPSLIFKETTQSQKSVADMDKSVTMPVNAFHFQHQKSDDGKQLITFPVTSAVGKQNSVALGTNTVGNGNLIKGVIKVLMPKSFSNTCSSQDTAQALKRIAKLSAVASSGGIYQNPISPANSKYNNAFNEPNAQIITVSGENILCSKNNIDSESASLLATDSSSIDEEFISMMEPEVLITESDDIFIIEDGKLKLCHSRKTPVRKKRNPKKFPKNKGKYPQNINATIPDEMKKVTNSAQSIGTSNEAKGDTKTVVSKENSSNPSLKRTADLELIQNTKYQRETLLPPAPKVRKLFICRTEKTASSLLQSCFVWLDKMNEQFLINGRLDTTETPEDVLFNVRDTSHPYTNTQRGYKYYESKAAYLDDNPIVIIEPPSAAKPEAADSISTEKINRKEAENRMADVLRLLEEKRKAIEILRQKNISHSVAPTVSETLK